MLDITHHLAPERRYQLLPQQPDSCQRPLRQARSRLLDPDAAGRQLALAAQQSGVDGFLEAGQVKDAAAARLDYEGGVGSG